MEQKKALKPLFKDKGSVPLQPLKEIDISYSVAPLVAVRIHLPYGGVDNLLVLDTDLPIGDLVFVHGVPLLQRETPYKVVLVKEKVPPKRYFFKQVGYTFGHNKILEIRDEEGDPFIPDITLQFVYSNYRLLLHRRPFTAKVLVQDEEEEEEAGGLQYEGKPITMDALECSFLVVGNLFVDHDVPPPATLQNGRKW
jgi:hypothetical protein